MPNCEAAFTVNALRAVAIRYVYWVLIIQAKCLLGLIIYV